MRKSMHSGCISRSISKIITISLALCFVAVAAFSIGISVLPEAGRYTNQATEQSVNQTAYALTTNTDGFKEFPDGYKYWHTDHLKDISGNYNFLEYRKGNSETDMVTVTVSSGATRGTAENPYVIETKSDWTKFVTSLSSNSNGAGKVYALANDIDWSSDGNDGYAYLYQFSGTLYGLNHTISNINFAANAGGLFNTMSSGIVTDLSVDNFTSYDRTTLHLGAIAGDIVGGENLLLNCHAVGDVSQKSASAGVMIGGIIGNLKTGSQSTSVFYRCSGKINLENKCNGFVALGAILGHNYTCYSLAYDCYGEIYRNNVASYGGANGAIVGNVPDALGFIFDGCAGKAEIIGGKSSQARVGSLTSGCHKVSQTKTTYVKNTYTAGRYNDVTMHAGETVSDNSIQSYNVENLFISPLGDSKPLASGCVGIGDYVRLMFPQEKYLSTEDALWTQAQNDLKTFPAWSNGYTKLATDYVYSIANSPVRNNGKIDIEFYEYINGKDTPSGIAKLEGYIPNSDTTLSALSKPGRTFLGWTTDITGEGTIYPANQTLSLSYYSDQKFYACWAPENDSVAKIALSADNVSYGTPVKLTATVTCTAMPSPLVVKGKWYKSDNLTNSLGTDTVLTVTDVKDSGTYVYDYLVYSQSEPLFRDTGSKTSDNVTINKAEVSMRANSFKLVDNAAEALIKEPYIGMDISGLGFTVVAEDENGKEVAGTYKWKISNTEIKKGDNTCSILFTPDDTDNYQEGNSSFKGEFKGIALPLNFVITEWSQTIVADLEYGNNNSAVHIVEQFKTKFNELLNSDSEMEAAANGRTPCFSYNGSTPTAINDFDLDINYVTTPQEIIVSFKDATYTVTLDYNDGVTQNDKLTYGYGIRIEGVRLKAPTHPNGWQFIGWFYTVEKDDGTTEEVQWDPDFTRVTEDVTLTAHWLQFNLRLKGLEISANKSSYDATVALTDGDLKVVAVYEAIDVPDGYPVPDVRKTLNWDDYKSGIAYSGGGVAPVMNNKGVTVTYQGVTSNTLELPVVPKKIDVSSLKTYFKNKTVSFESGVHQTISIPLSAYDDSTSLGRYISSIKYVYINQDNEVLPDEWAVAIGEYTVRAVFTTKSENYTIDYLEATLTITAGKSEVTVSWDDTKLSFVYNADVQYPTPIIKDKYGEIITTLTLDMTFTGSKLVNGKPVNVGKYTVTVSLSDDDTAYTLSATSVLTANFDITQLVIAKPTVNGTLTYNGDTQSVETLLQGYDSKYMELKQSVTGKDADEYRVMVEIISPDNVSWGGGTSINLTWEIKKKSISAQWDKFKFVVTDSVVIPKVTSLDGIVDDIIVNCENGRDILIVYNNGEPATEVGSYKAVASLNGSDGWKKNYVLDRNTEWDYVILPKDGVTVVDIEWDTDTFEYDGKGHTPTAVVKDMDGNEITVNIVYKGDKGAVWAKDGGYTVSVELPEEYFIRKDKSCNYNIVENNENEGGLDDPENPNNPDSKKVTVEWSATELKYNGSAQHPTVTVKDLQGNVLTDVVVRYTGDTDAVWAKIGKYSVTVSVTGYSIVGDNATCEFTIVANDEGKGGLDDPRNPNNTSKEPDTGNEGGGIPKDFPLWQTIVSGISLVLIIALGAKIILDAGKIKKLNKKTEKAKAQAVYSATFGTDMLLMGSLAMQARWWSAIAISLAGLALLMVVIAFVIRGKVNKAEEAYEEAEKRAVESERRKRDEEMKMMFMMLNNRGGAGGYDQTNVEGTTVYPDQNIEQIVQRVVTALLPSTTHTESVETNSENDAMARLIEQQSEMIDKQARIIEQMQMNQNVLDDDFDDEEDNDYYDEEDDFYEQELAADGEAQPVYEAEVLLDEAKPRIPSNFRMRLKVSSVKNHDAYVAIKNKLCSKKEITFRISGRTEKVKYHGEVIAIIGVARKSLKLWLALDPNSIEQSRYHQKDVSDKPRYAHVPMLLRVGSDRALKRAMEVLDILFETYSIEDRKKYKDKSLQELAYTLKRNALVRNKRVELLRDSIHVHDADALTNEEAAQYVEYKAREAYEYENFATITLDVLEENFYDGQKVTLDKLKHKGLIPEEYNGYVITTGERLTKPLYVVADGYSAVAVKMIVLTGGRAIQLAEVTHEDVQ